MLILPLRYQYLIGFILIILMIATREYHFAALHSLPGASWAVFFLAGVYLRSSWSLLGFLALILVKLVEVFLQRVDLILDPAGGAGQVDGFALQAA